MDGLLWLGTGAVCGMALAACLFPLNEAAAIVGIIAAIVMCGIDVIAATKRVDGNRFQPRRRQPRD